MQPHPHLRTCGFARSSPPPCGLLAVLFGGVPMSRRQSLYTCGTLLYTLIASRDDAACKRGVVRMDQDCSTDKHVH